MVDCLILRRGEVVGLWFGGNLPLAEVHGDLRVFRYIADGDRHVTRIFKLDGNVP